VCVCVQQFVLLNTPLHTMQQAVTANATDLHNSIPSAMLSYEALWRHKTHLHARRHILQRLISYSHQTPTSLLTWQSCNVMATQLGTLNVLLLLYDRQCCSTRKM